MPDRVISVPQAAQIATKIKNKFDNVNGRLHQQGILSETYSNAGSTSPSNKVTHYPITLTAGKIIRLKFVSYNSNVKFRVQLRSENNLNSASLIRQIHYGTDDVDKYLYVSEHMATAVYLTVWAVETSEAFSADVTVEVSSMGTVYNNEQAVKSVENFMLDGFSLFNPVYFVRGNWSTFDVLSPNYTNRVSSNIHFTTDESTFIKTRADGFVFYVLCSTDGGTTVELSGWVTEYIVPANAEYVLLIKRITETASENADIETFVSSVCYRTGIGNTLAEIDSIKNVVGTLPAYYTDVWLKARYDYINAASAFVNGVTFAFFTDPHFGANAGNSKILLKRIIEKTPCSTVICGGDYALAYGTEEQLKESYDTLLDYAGYIGHDNFFALCGNHDFYITASTSDSTRQSYTWGKTYSGIFRPSEKWQLNSEKAGYYCIDNEAQKSRVICLNSCEPPQITSGAVVDGLVRVRPAQIVWLAERILEKTGWKIIVISHYTSDSSMPYYSANMANVQKILEAFVAKTSVTIEFSSTYTRTFDFTQTTNLFVCHINGHAHSDASHVSNGVLSISTTCDAYYNNDGHGAVVGTVTEQAFDVYCIDYDAETITAVRVGRGASRKWSFDGTVIE